MALDLQSLLELLCRAVPYSLVETPQVAPPPPHYGHIRNAIGQQRIKDRRHLFVTPLFYCSGCGGSDQVHCQAGTNCFLQGTPVFLMFRIRIQIKIRWVQIQKSQSKVMAHIFL
jgi:hypothetical protein